MTPDPGDRLVVGRIGRAHGLRGEVAVTFTQQPPRALRAGRGAVRRATASSSIDASRPAPGPVLVRFDGVDDRTAAERLLGVVLTADPLAGDADVLDDDELWVHELDRRARSSTAPGTPVGRVIAVEANPAHDLLVLDGGALVPDGVRRRARATACSSIDPPDGLLDL